MFCTAKTAYCSFVYILLDFEYRRKVAIINVKYTSEYGSISSVAQLSIPRKRINYVYKYIRT